MKRKTELYKIILQDKHVNEKGFFDELKSDIILKKFFDYYYENIVDKKTIDEVATDEDGEDNNEITNNKYKIKKDIKSKNICYYVKSVEEVDSKDEEIDKIRNITIEYIKYSKKLKIVDKDTLEEKFQKDKNQGDLERQHYVIKSLANSNKALIIWEKVLGAVTLGLIEKDINSVFRIWVKDKYSDDDEKKKNLLGFNIKIYPIPSKDFFEELANLQKVSLMKITVSREKITSDEDILYSGDNVCRDDVELIYKPKDRLSLSKRKIENYVRKFINGTEVKKILIDGKKDGNLIKLNTELMKMSKHIDIKIDEDGLIDSHDLFVKYNELINIDEDYFKEIFIDEDME